MRFPFPSLERLAISLIDYGLVFITSWPESICMVWIRYRYPYPFHLGSRLAFEYNEINQWLRDNASGCDLDHRYSDNPVVGNRHYTISEGVIRFRDRSMATMFAMRFGGDGRG